LSTELIIDVTPQETRVALLEGGIVTEYHIERARDRGLAGNIYKGKVLRVLPGMQAAFVDVGLERAAFLYVADVAENIPESRLRKDDEENGEAGVAPAPADSYTPIEELLREGQELMVQVAKEPIGTKGARLTTHVTMPGRHLVLMPTVDHVGISRRIESEAERKRLREIVETVRRDGLGFIVRTAAEGTAEKEIATDAAYLVEQWAKIREKLKTAAAPAVLYADLNITLRIIRDLFTGRVDRVVINSKEEYERILRYFADTMPRLGYSVELYEADEPIFDHYGLEIEIARALQRKVWLRSGGYIVIQSTEALTAIDVNTGRYVGKYNLEDTIIRTNLEAVKEICYQLRLRNIGGIIILDFIDMDKEANREKVYQSLQDTLRADKAKTNILKISELGLVEMTRKRIRESIDKIVSEPCPYCEGRGVVKSRAGVCYDLFREVRRRKATFKGKTLTIHVHMDIADLLFEEERAGLEDLEKLLGKRIIVKGKQDFHIEQFEIIES
jgi:ribonuclease G